MELVETPQACWPASSHRPHCNLDTHQGILGRRRRRCVGQRAARWALSHPAGLAGPLQRCWRLQGRLLHVHWNLRLALPTDPPRSLRALLPQTPLACHRRPSSADPSRHCHLWAPAHAITCLSHAAPTPPSLSTLSHHKYGASPGGLLTSSNSGTPVLEQGPEWDSLRYQRLRPMG